MKNLYLLLLAGAFVLLTPSQVSAQGRIGAVHQTYKPEQTTPTQVKQKSAVDPRIEISPLYGYQLNGKVKFYQGEFNMKGASNYGAAISARVSRGTLAEFAYTISDTRGEYYNFNDRETEYYDMNIHYFQLGVVKELMQDKVRPFGTFTGGITWFDMKDAYTSDYVCFSIAAGGGVKIMLSDRIGIRLQGRLLLPMYWQGGGFSVGIGNGGASSSTNIYLGVVAAQGDFSGGLIFRLGN